jgi:hypothetical protein
MSDGQKAYYPIPEGTEIRMGLRSSVETKIDTLMQSVDRLTAAIEKMQVAANITVHPAVITINGVADDGLMPRLQEIIKENSRKMQVDLQRNIGSFNREYEKRHR